MRELELKYDLGGADGLNRALGCQTLRRCAAGAAKKIKMSSTYYDNSEGSLARAGITFRIRKENDSEVATFKCGGGVFGGMHEREEHETVSGGKEPERLFFELLEKSTLVRAEAVLSRELASSGLVKVCFAEFERTSVMLEFGGAGIEFCADCGIVAGGSKTEPFWELELELKSGEGGAAALDELAALISAEGINLKPQPKSKYARARALALGK